MANLGLTTNEPGEPRWYCVHTQSKREHIAASWLARQLAVETYLPRIKFRRAEARGPVWTVEALFPTYLFGRFVLAESLRHVERVPGVIGVVHFGANRPPVPDWIIDGLRSRVDGTEAHVVEEQMAPGAAVRIVSGPFQGLEAVISRAMPGRERVNVLLDLLGGQTAVEVSRHELVGLGEPRDRLW